jgi:hypothetical protein
MNVSPENLLRLLDLEDEGSMIIHNNRRLASSAASVGTSDLTEVLFLSAFFPIFTVYNLQEYKFHN